MSRFNLYIMLGGVLAFAVLLPVAASQVQAAPISPVPLPKLERAYSLIGTPVDDLQGDHLGTLSEIVLTPEQNHLSYGVLTVGSTFGLGGRNYAIPWPAFQMSPDHRALVLDINKAKLDASPGFDPDHWPNAGDYQWAGKHAQELAEVPTLPPADMWNRRLSMLMGVSVKNLYGDNLGRIKDFVLNAAEATVDHVDIAFGAAEARVASFPWDEVTLLPSLQTARLDTEQRSLGIVAFKAGRTPSLRGEEAAVAREKIAARAWMPGSAYNRQFDPKLLVSVSGVIERVETFYPEKGAAEGLRLLVRTAGGGTVSVDVGPAGYVDRHELRFYYGDTVYVNGSEREVGGRIYVMATDIHRDDNFLYLRDTSGAPLWEPDETGNF